MEVVRLFDAPTARFGAAGSLMVAHYSGRTTTAVLEELDRQQEALAKRYPRLSTLTLIGQAGMERPEEQVRERSLALGKKYEEVVRGSAIVVTTRGIGAVMVRTFLSAFFLLNKSKMPMKVFASVGEALKWLHTLDGDDASYRELSSEDVLRFTGA